MTPRSPRTPRTPSSRSSTARSRSARDGSRVRRAGARAGHAAPTHPGQYIVLNSEDGRVATRRARPRAARPSCSTRWASGRRRSSCFTLAGPPAARPDRPFRGRLRAALGRAHARGWWSRTTTAPSGSAHVLELRADGRPLVWDILHHHCHDPDAIPDREALELALATWPEGVMPKIHYSTPRTAVEEREAQRPPLERSPGPPPAARPRGPGRPDRFRALPARDRGRPGFDVMLEAKAKDLALLRLREQLARRGIVSRGRELRIGDTRAGRVPAGYVDRDGRR